MISQTVLAHKKAPRKGLRSLLLKYSDGWIEQTPYCLPNYTGRVPLGASSDINTAVEAGLPNIYGEFAPREGVGFIEDGVYSGAFSAGNNYGIAQVNFVAASPHVKLNFNASNCSSIYGKSTTVQPPSVKCAFLIRHD